MEVCGLSVLFEWSLLECALEVVVVEAVVLVVVDIVVLVGDAVVAAAVVLLFSWFMNVSYRRCS